VQVRVTLHDEPQQDFTGRLVWGSATKYLEETFNPATDYVYRVPKTAVARKYDNALTCVYFRIAAFLQYSATEPPVSEEDKVRVFFKIYEEALVNVKKEGYKLWHRLPRKDETK
jgi:hypothetical protein